MPQIAARCSAVFPLLFLASTSLWSCIKRSTTFSRPWKQIHFISNWRFVYSYILLLQWTHETVYHFQQPHKSKFPLYQRHLHFVHSPLIVRFLKKKENGISNQLIQNHLKISSLTILWDSEQIQIPISFWSWEKRK